MKSAQIIVLAVGLMNVVAGRLIIERRLNREFNMCGPPLFAVLDRICGIQRYNSESTHTQGTQKPSISAMCCSKKCKVVDIITTFCPNKRFQDGHVRPNVVEVLPMSTEKTTTPPSVTITKMTTTTEKLASIWFITG